MNIEFANIETIRQDIKELISSIPAFFREISPYELDRFDHITIRVVSDDVFRCEIAFNSQVIISQKTIEIIWALNYSHLYYFDTFIRSEKPDGQSKNLKSRDWKLIKKQLSWGVDSLKGYNLKQNSKFNRQFFRNNNYGLIFNFSLLFFISHELFHTINKDISQEIIVEEKMCDFDATNFIMNSFSDENYLEKAKGICLGLMLLNVYGIHSGNYDGKTHPFSYDRLIENLELLFGKENDKIWGLIVSIFSLHFTHENIEQPKNEFVNFYDCILEYRNILSNRSN